MGLSFSPSTLLAFRRINDAVWEDYRQGRMSASRLKSERFRRLLGELEADGRQAERLSQSFLDRISERGDRLPGCRTLLRRLRRRYQLGVVTNGIDRVQRSRLRVAGLDGLFDVVVTSEACGFAKPDPRILVVALEALVVAPHQAVYVGDDVANDGGAARAAGIPFCWVDNGGGQPAGHRRPRRSVRSLREIPGTLGL